ncbi:TetR/AcrR family transcriptional regulator [Amycolatopsis sp. PS_44_ISF1]|uniref:TetR/AcrR family transcriptional regulator n=1 Tax=Amycolatopsis sp. PS_44_ISF1 TaxID=2974917 RepID=UPI0028E053EB|nr:TetR/AcrR family transcriptional regulator [Amycolatopsis sp. PS_44_ISF1]MDT8911223.1 TetR/AcrR family transcriptional regulator [Amycolatopsis sp. PS_44_ISF1]
MSSAGRVHAAAVKLFAAKGFHGTGIRDLAQEAELSSAGLYHYMGTKEDLLVEIMTTSLRRLLDAAAKATAGAGDPVSRLRTLVALHVLAHAVQPAETRVVDNEVDALSDAARARVVALRDEYEDLWAQAIEDGAAAGVFHTGHPAVTRLALLEMCNGVARWYSPRGPLPLEGLAAHYAELALRALGFGGSVTVAELRPCLEVVAQVWDVPV